MDYTTLEPLYHTICRGHAQRLFDLYNSVHNPYNKSPNSKKLDLVFSPAETVNASSNSSNVDTITLHTGLLKKTHECIYTLIKNDNSISNEQDKALIGTFLFSISCHFIIAHEFGHIYLGHCDLPNPNISKSVSLHIAYDSRLGISPLDFQTLEMNADSLAMCRTFDYTLFRPYHHIGILNLVHDQNRAFELLIHAINITFFVLRYMMPPIADPSFESKKHHPIFLRQVMNLHTLLKYINSEYGYSVSFDFLYDHLISDEAKLCDLYFIPLVADHYMNNLSPLMLNHEQQLRTNWNNIRDKLIPYARSPLNDIFI